MSALRVAFCVAMVVFDVFNRALIYKYRWTIELTFKKTETKLSTALLLLGNGKRDKDTGLVHADCPFAVKRGAGLVREQKGVFNHCGTGADTLD